MQCNVKHEKQIMTDFNSRIFSHLKTTAGSHWSEYVEHEFVRQLGDGSLPREAFLHYLKQDYVFLINYSRAWALAVVKSDRIDEMRIAAATVNGLIDEEIKLHIATCEREGIDESTLGQLAEEPENLAYTRFVMDIGLRGDLLDLMASLAPCVFGYGEIGLRLASRIKGPLQDQPYGEWIATYVGDEYQQVCNAVGAMMDNVASRRIGGDLADSPRSADLQSIFNMACDLETSFWSMGLKLVPSRQ